MNDYRQVANLLERYNQGKNDVYRLENLLKIAKKASFTDEKAFYRAMQLIDEVEERIKILSQKKFKCIFCDNFQSDEEIEYDTHLLWIHESYRQLCGTMNDVKKKAFIDHLLRIFHCSSEKHQYYILKILRDFKYVNLPVKKQAYKIYDKEGKIIVGKNGKPKLKFKIITYESLETQYGNDNEDFEKFLRYNGMKTQNAKEYDQWLANYNKEMSDPMYKQKLWLDDGTVNPNVGN